MGNSFSSDPRFYEGRKLLNGNHTVQRRNLTYEGTFDAGWFISGEVTKQNELCEPVVVASGKFKFNQLLKGTREENLQELVGVYVPTELMDYFEDVKPTDIAYVIGQYHIDDSGLEIPTLDGHCTIYFDEARTVKFLDANFERDDLVSGNIYANDDANTLLASGVFECDDHDNPYLKDGALLDKISVCGIVLQNLYLKTGPLMIGACYENDYTGDAEYYKDHNFRNLVVKCDLLNGEIHGTFTYFVNNEVSVSGIVENEELKEGVMKYGGFYVKGSFVDGKPHGDAELYYDSECIFKYASAHYKYGALDGIMIIYDKTGCVRSTIVYSDGNVVQTSDSDQIRITPDNETKTAYPRFISVSNDEKTQSFVHESDLIVSLNEIQALNNRSTVPNGILADTFMLWLEEKMVDKEWLFTLNQTDSTFFTKFVGDEIESLLKLAGSVFRKSEEAYPEEYAGLSNKRIFANAFYEILNNPEEYKVNTDLANTLLADIYNEYLQFCSVCLHCKMITSIEFTAITARYFDYICVFSKSSNTYTISTKSQTRINTPLKVWLSGELSDNYENVKKIIGADLLNIIKSRCGKMTKNHDEFANALINQLNTPLNVDVRNKRDVKMREALQRLQKNYKEFLENSDE